MVVIRLIRALGRLILWLNFMFPTKGHIVSSGRQYRNRNAFLELLYGMGALLVLSIFFSHFFAGDDNHETSTNVQEQSSSISFSNDDQDGRTEKSQVLPKESINIQRKKETKERISFAVRYFETVFSHSNLP